MLFRSRTLLGAIVGLILFAGALVALLDTGIGHRFLTDRLFSCELAGIDRRRVLVDPGFGFGKNLEHNLALLRATGRFAELGAGAYVGLSRKSMIGAITGREDPRARVSGSVAAALVAVQRGAVLVRVHDVAPTVDALAVWAAVKAGDGQGSEERRVGKECLTQCRSRWSPYH